MNGNAPRHETQIAYHRRRATELQTIRNPWDAEWRVLAEFIEPSRYRNSLKAEGPISRAAILDGHGTKALRTLKSGMHSGITSPARPWFRLATPFDPELRDFGPVKSYLSAVENRMREVFQASNVYNAFHTGYGDLGQFGQSCAILVEDPNSILRMMQLIHGSFWIARDETGRATTLYRRFRWSIERIVNRFGTANLNGQAKTAWDTSKYDTTFDIWHAIEPRKDRDTRKIDKRNKRFLSNYWFDGGNDHNAALLEESGFDDNPIIAPPWELAADDHYSISPGQICLADVKGLQLMTRRLFEAIDKKVRPPMTGPTSMRNNPASLLPGAITYVDGVGTSPGFRPAMEVNLDISHLSVLIRDNKDGIDRSFFADLFLMLANMQGIQPRNAFEIAERKEEKLLALGPVLENIYAGQLEPTIDRAFAILNERGELPEPPRELQNRDLKVEYISILAQAQKAVATGAIDRITAFVAQVSAGKPETLDKFDADEAIDIYADMLGAPPSIIVPDDKVKELRDARAKKQRAAEQAQMAATLAPAANQGAQAAAVMADAGSSPGGSSLLQTLGIG